MNKQGQVRSESEHNIFKGTFLVFKKWQKLIENCRCFQPVVNLVFPVYAWTFSMTAWSSYFIHGFMNSALTVTWKCWEDYVFFNVCSIFTVHGITSSNIRIKPGFQNTSTSYTYVQTYIRGLIWKKEKEESRVEQSRNDNNNIHVAPACWLCVCCSCCPLQPVIFLSSLLSFSHLS